MVCTGPRRVVVAKHEHYASPSGVQVTAITVEPATEHGQRGGFELQPDRKRGKVAGEIFQTIGLLLEKILVVLLVCWRDGILFCSYPKGGA
jgi:hypothetical protein